MAVATGHADRLLAAAFVACLLAVVAALPVPAAVAAIGLLTVALCVAAHRVGNHVALVLAGAFLFRLAIIAVDSVLRLVPRPPIAASHGANAMAVASAWTRGRFLGTMADVELMRTVVAHLLAPFYLLVGDSPVVGRLGVAVLSLAVGYFAYRITARVATRRAGVGVLVVVSFWPTIVYRSVVVQREVVLAGAMLGLLWAATRWLDRVTLRSVLVAAVAVGLVVAMREENLLLVAAVVGTVLLARGRRRPYYLLFAGVVSVPLVVLFALNFGAITGYGATLSPAALDAFAYGRAHGDAAYLVGLHYRSWLDVLVYAPLKVVFFLFTPFPWQVRGVVELVVGLSALGLFGLTVLARRGVAVLTDRPGHLFVLLAYLVTGVAAYAIIEMNYGAAVRRRIQFVPVIAILAVIGLSRLTVEVRTARG